MDWMLLRRRGRVLAARERLAPRPARPGRCRRPDRPALQRRDRPGGTAPAARAAHLRLRGRGPLGAPDRRHVRPSPGGRRRALDPRPAGAEGARAPGGHRRGPSGCAPGELPRRLPQGHRPGRHHRPRALPQPRAVRAQGRQLPARDRGSTRTIRGIWRLAVGALGAPACRGPPRRGVRPPDPRRPRS